MISFAILVHNEGSVIERLLKQIILVLTPLCDFEIIIIDDFSTDDVTIDIINKYKLIDNIHVFQRALNKDFASQKNFANSKCNGTHIINVDADEYFSDEMIENLPELLENNDNIDLFWCPRINTVEGLTDEHIQKWGWKVNDKGWVQFPDFQARIYRNSPEINWVGKVHEVVEGAMTVGKLPAEEDWCIIHPKSIRKQEMQNEFYNTIS